MAVSKVLSIEISELNTKVIEVSYGAKKPVVTASLIFDNPDYCVEDGYVSDRPGFISIFREKTAAAGIKTKDAVFVLASNKVVSREITIPEMKDNLITELIANEHDEYFPMDTTDHVFTFHILEKLKEQKQMKVLVYAAPEILIRNYTALAAELDLNMVAIDYTGNAAYQWLKNAPEKMSMYLQINEKNAMFTILEEGSLALQRNMNFGLKTLCENLDDEGTYGRLTLAEARERLESERLLYPSFEDTSKPLDITATEKDARMHALKSRLTEVTRPLLGNIARVLEYYNTRAKHVDSFKIYLGGAGAKVQGLKELIESEFGGVEIEVCERLTGFTNKERGGSVVAERSTEFISVLGASSLTINFFKKSDKEKLSSTTKLEIFALVITVLASAFMVVNGLLAYLDAKADNSKLAKQVAAFEATDIEELEARAASADAFLNEVKDFDNRTVTKSEMWLDVLSDIERVAVKGMTVTSLTASDSEISMNLIVNSKKEAAKILIELKRLPYFTDVTLNNIMEQLDEDTGLTSVTFSVMCVYDNAVVTDVEETIPEETQEVVE